MKFRILTTLVFLVTLTTNSQEKLGYFFNNLKKSSYSINIKEIFPVVNQQNGNTVVFLKDAKNIYAYKLNDSFKVISKIALENSKRKFKTLLGFSISDNEDYSLYLSNKSKNKFIRTTFSFKNKKSSSREFTLGNNEEFVQTASLNNKFYLITSKKHSDIVNLHIHQNENSESKKIDFSDQKIIDKLGQGTYVGNLLLYKPFIASDGFVKNKKSEEIIKIDSDVPNAIEIVSKTNKMYLNKDQIIFTFDSSNKNTQAIVIDPEKYKGTFKSFPKDLRSAKKTNSFFVDEKIFISTTNKNKLFLQIFDFNSEKLLKKYTIEKDKPISFKNTPIIQEGGAYTMVRKLESAKKFLRKINAGEFGISARKTNNTYKVTIGGYVKKASPGQMGAMGFSMTMSGSFLSPTFNAFVSSSNTRSIRIKSLLDLNFEHVKDKIPDNVFDKINDYTFNNSLETTIFKYKDFYIKGEYSQGSKLFTLKKFTD
ncbi:hypothetical protein [Tenacibaculum geojense]|uniref:Uncharacterized protein n=1 Tax=Tenacibaculum geojense TaxID=915352 RepID=A0ABW3JUR3_9FLAO